jgi:hypothetical protein
MSNFLNPSHYSVNSRADTIDLIQPFENHFRIDQDLQEKSEALRQVISEMGEDVGRMTTSQTATGLHSWQDPKLNAEKKELQKKFEKELEQGQTSPSTNKRVHELGLDTLISNRKNKREVCKELNTQARTYFKTSKETSNAHQKTLKAIDGLELFCLYALQNRYIRANVDPHNPETFPVRQTRTLNKAIDQLETIRECIQEQSNLASVDAFRKEAIKQVDRLFRECLTQEEQEAFAPMIHEAKTALKTTSTPGIPQVASKDKKNKKAEKKDDTAGLVRFFEENTKKTRERISTLTGEESLKNLSSKKLRTTLATQAEVRFKKVKTPSPLSKPDRKMIEATVDALEVFCLSATQSEKFQKDVDKNTKTVKKAMEELESIREKGLAERSVIRPIADRVSKHISKIYTDCLTSAEQSEFSKPIERAQKVLKTI